jgi:hypothetical protein
MALGHSASRTAPPLGYEPLTGVEKLTQVQATHSQCGAVPRSGVVWILPDYVSSLKSLAEALTPPKRSS